MKEQQTHLCNITMLTECLLKTPNGDVNAHRMVRLTQSSKLLANLPGVRFVRGLQNTPVAFKLLPCFPVGLRT